MKKILLILVALLILCGCGANHDSGVSNGDEVIYTRPDGGSYTKQSLYEDMKLNDFTAYLTNDLVVRLAGFEGIDIEALKQEATDDAQAAIDAGQEYYLIYYYGSVDNYIEQMVPYKAVNALAKREIEADFDTYVNDYSPYKAQIAYFDDLEAAQNVIDAVNSGENSFAYACTANGYAGIVEETIYTDKDLDLPVEVKAYVNNSNEGLSTIIETSTTITDADGNSIINPRYYLVDLISKNVDDFKDEFMDLVAADVDTTTTISNLLKKYEVSIHDQRAYELLSATYEVLK